MPERYGSRMTSVAVLSSARTASSTCCLEAYTSWARMPHNNEVGRVAASNMGRRDGDRNEDKDGGQQNDAPHWRCSQTCMLDTNFRTAIVLREIGTSNLILSLFQKHSSG